MSPGIHAAHLLKGMANAPVLQGLPPLPSNMEPSSTCTGGIGGAPGSVSLHGGRMAGAGGGRMSQPPPSMTLSQRENPQDASSLIHNVPSIQPSAGMAMPSLFEMKEDAIQASEEVDMGDNNSSDSEVHV